MDDNFTKIKNLLTYTTLSDKTYNGQNYDAGYHTLNIHGKTILGQRKPLYRLENLNYNFQEKIILDIGCNQGGMLFELQNKIKEGVGIDYNPKLINVATRISNSHNYNNLSFYTFDLDNEDLNLIINFLNNPIDVIFLLSVCMWIKNWENLIAWVYQNSNYCLFETNGKSAEQIKQIEVLKSFYKKVDIIRETSDDDPKQKKRSTLWCQK